MKPPRYAFIHFPEFCHQHIRITKRIENFVLVKESHRALYISDLSQHEYHQGLRRHMSLADAKAIVPDIIYFLHDDKTYKNEFLRLSHQSLRFSPLIAVDEDYGILLNISGCPHLFGGEAAMLEAIETYFLQQGFYIKKAIAPNPLLAKTLAYFSSDTIVEGSVKPYLAPLPIDALFIDRGIIDALHDLGITNLASLLQLPRKDLAQRFGINLCQKLDQILGIIHIPPTYLVEKPIFAIDENFTSPIRTHDHFIEITNLLLSKLMVKLEQHYLSLRGMSIVFKDCNKKISRLSIEATVATNDRKHWQELIALKIETLRFDDGIELIRLRFTQIEPLRDQQKDFSHKNDTALSRIFITDRLKSRLGEQAIFHLRKTEKHLPEHAVTKDFSLQENSKTKGPKYPLPKRPLRLLKKPLPVRVIALVPDHPPVRIFGTKHTINVVHATGPERIEHEWWAHDLTHRDYFYVEDDKGRRWWIFSSGQPKEWFIHGVFI